MASPTAVSSTPPVINSTADSVAPVERARRTGETIRPECPYARAWLAKHPDEVEGITVDLSGLAD